MRIKGNTKKHYKSLQSKFTSSKKSKSNKQYISLKKKRNSRKLKSHYKSKYRKSPRHKSQYRSKINRLRSFGSPVSYNVKKGKQFCRGIRDDLIGTERDVPFPSYFWAAESCDPRTMRPKNPSKIYRYEAIEDFPIVDTGYFGNVHVNSINYLNNIFPDKFWKAFPAFSSPIDEKRVIEGISINTDSEKPIGITRQMADGSEFIFFQPYSEEKLKSV